MYNHFSVILLYLSGVYCISSKIDNLDWQGLNNILNGQTAIDEWSATMDQTILEEHANGSKTPLNVKDALKKFADEVRADESALTKFESIRNIIKTAYQCTLAKYASLATFLIFQDIWQVKTVTNYTIDIVKNDPDVQNRRVNMHDRFRRKFTEFSSGKYHTDFDVNIEEEKFTIFPEHNLSNDKQREIHYLWREMIDKTLRFNIKHKIYSDVMRTKFRNIYDKPRVDVLNKLMCVFNEAIIMLDNFIVDKCVQHGGSFVKNFESLKTGVDIDLKWLLENFDEERARGFVQLYKDFTHPYSPHHPTLGSGCFVEKFEIKVAGLTVDLPNPNDPTTIYGNIADRQSETKIKIVETIDSSPGGLRVAMVSIRDPTTLSIDVPQSRPKRPADEEEEEEEPIVMECPII